MTSYLNNSQIADLLRSVACAYEIKGKDANKFRIIAYERAADAIEHLSSEAKDLFDEGKLADIPGVGKSISEALSDMFLRGKSKHFDSVLSGINKSVFELIKLPGIGPKTAHRLTKEFRIDPQDPFKNLLAFAKEGKIAKLEGFGEESQKEIIQAIEEYKDDDKRLLINYASDLSSSIIDWMNGENLCESINVLGSLRRRASTVGDIDIAAATENPSQAIDRFVNFPNKSRVIEKGTLSASILLPNGVQVDFMVSPLEAYGAMLQHFTGSKHHNIKLRERALKMGLSLNEKGIKILDSTKSNKSNIKRQKFNSKLKIYEFSDEVTFYNALGLEYIDPELREDNGEIEAALRRIKGKKTGLPKLVELKDVKADLQIHSSFDVETSHDLGLSSIKEIVNKASSLGYDYIALTEHNPSQKGHNEIEIVEILKKKKYTIEQLNDSLEKDIRVKHVYNCLEIDILPDGKLPVSSKALELLDFALVSVHSSFRLSKCEMTKRVLDALSYPKAKIFAHPSARKLTEREGIDLDWEKVFDFCLKNNKWIEINCDPMRLDLPDILVKEAVKYGIKLTLGTDAHHVDHMDNMCFGIDVARRGWAQMKDIVNTSSYEEFTKMLE